MLSALLSTALSKVGACGLGLLLLLLFATIFVCCFEFGRLRLCV